jgi:hypothetical protein
MSDANSQLLRQRLRHYHYLDEAQVVEELIALARCSPAEKKGIDERATPLVQAVP